jgi:hypothetical protein
MFHLNNFRQNTYDTSVLWQAEMQIHRVLCLWQTLTRKAVSCMTLSLFQMLADRATGLYKGQHCCHHCN